MAGARLRPERPTPRSPARSLRAGRVEAARDVCRAAAAWPRRRALHGARAALPAFVEFARALCDPRVGRLDEARALHDEMLEATGAHVPPHRYFSALLDGARRAGDSLMLLQVSSAMRVAGYETDAADMSVIMHGLAEAGMLDSAVALFRAADDGRRDLGTHHAHVRPVSRGRSPSRGGRREAYGC